MSSRYDSDLEPVTAPEPATLPSEHDRNRRSLLGRILATLAVAAGALVKFGAFGLKFFGIFLAVGGYALIWGWRFGLGVVLLILVHELGHYVEAKRAGPRPAAPRLHPVPRGVRRPPEHALRPVGERARLARRADRGRRRRAPRALSPRSARTPTSCARSRTPGFLLNLLNLAPIGILDGGHVLRSWRVLRAGGGASTPARARQRAMVVALVSLATAAALIAGMVAAHVPQDRL